MPSDQPWTASREEPERYSSDLTLLGHAAAQLENMTGYPDESLCLYINRYSNIHCAAKRTLENTLSKMFQIPGFY